MGAEAKKRSTIDVNFQVSLWKRKEGCLLKCLFYCLCPHFS